MIRKVLVANRGEIACRIMKTLGEMGIASVAVYSDVDADAPHVWLADEAVKLGAPRSYLDTELILQAARSTGTGAVHPGYGFLAENASFAAACAGSGITFIGPSPEAMRALGDKRAARKVAEDAGVPVVPGGRDCDTVEAAVSAASKTGYPVLIKAAGGGGGKGMRLVRSAEELPEAYAGARREAEAAFSDPRLLVEKYVHPARHVEVQILADCHDAVALGERECSLQRRYQKLIEESPSPGIGGETRAGLLECAVKLARKAGYTNAGTVEFLVGPDGSYYFLEVNTRLQVEHPVTEMLVGMDIVAAQIEIASGGRVPAPSAPRGHAIEARLNAEDPYNRFLPASGRIHMLDWPSRPGVRIDSGICDGWTVQPHYDPLLAKIIAWGSDRDHARRRLIAALRHTTLLGLPTNLAFLVQLLESDEFIAGRTYTSTIEARGWERPETPEEAATVARDALRKRAGDGAATDGRSPHRHTPWLDLGGFRMGGGKAV